MLVVDNGVVVLALDPEAEAEQDESPHWVQMHCEHDDTNTSIQECVCTVR